MVSKKTDLMERLSGFVREDGEMKLVQFKIPKKDWIKIRDTLKAAGLLPRELYLEAAAILMENVQPEKTESKARSILRRSGHKDSNK